MPAEGVEYPQFSERYKTVLEPGERQEPGSHGQHHGRLPGLVAAPEITRTPVLMRGVAH
jgi:hypothetical protein